MSECFFSRLSVNVYFFVGVEVTSVVETMVNSKRTHRGGVVRILQLPLTNPENSLTFLEQHLSSKHHKHIKQYVSSISLI